MVWLICILALISIILFFPVNITASYVYSAEQKQNIFKVDVFGFNVYKSGKKKTKKSPSEKKEEKKQKKFSFEDYKNILEKWKNDSEGKIKKSVKGIFKNLKRFADLKKACCNFEFGTGDAALTGIAAGVAYGAIYNIFAKIYYYFNIKKKNLNIDVSPDFTKEKMELYIEFVFAARLIFLGFIVINLIKAYSRLKTQ